MTSKTLDIATELADKGLRVFPTLKTWAPAISNWTARASTEHDKINQWWNVTHHGAGIGVATVNTPTSGRSK